MNRVCPSCGTIHESAQYAGCCSRGCMRFHQRRERKPAARRPKPSPLARELLAVVIAPQPPPEPLPPPTDVMILCDVCQVKSPDWATFEIGACKVCCSCRPEFLARKKERDDRARPGCPSMGGGVRVIRSTKGLS